MPGSELVYRHTLATRAMHWVNALCVFLVLLSGLQIFNAHPRLYWGQYGANSDLAVLAIEEQDSSDGRPLGVVRIGTHALRTTGFLGVSKNGDGEPVERAFPSWLTIPSYQDLATGRRWHFFFAWLLVFNSAVYFLVGLFRRHIQRDLWLTRAQWKPSHTSVASVGRCYTNLSPSGLAVPNRASRSKRLPGPAQAPGSRARYQLRDLSGDLGAGFGFCR